MRAVVVRKSADIVFVRDRTRPIINSGDVMIRVRAVALSGVRIVDVVEGIMPSCSWVAGSCFVGNADGCGS